MNTPNKITPVIYGTLVMTLSAIIPLINFINLFCCAGVIAGGFVGAYSYWKQLRGTSFTMTAKDGGMIGILSGILSAVFVTGFGLITFLFADTNPMLDVMKTFDSMGFQMPPEMNQYIEKFSDEFSRHGFSPTITIFSFVANIIIYPLFGTIGAILAVTLLNKKSNPAN